MKVLLTATSLLPVYGGPAYSVSRLAAALTDAGVEVGLWAADQSARATSLLSRDLSVRRLAGSAIEALDDYGRVDILHDNGLWLAHNHKLAKIAAKRGIVRVVSPRGMLEPWAMNHKRWKKQIAWWLYQRQDLVRAQCLHMTAESEVRHAQRLALDVPMRMVPNGVDLPPRDSRLEKAAADARKTAFFLGRIYPVKGLPMLIEAWSRARPAGWVLQIAGPDEAGHRAQVERAVAQAGLGDVVSFMGPLEGPAKASAFSVADLFVLPSYSESFGMAVAEALAHGVPVLTTTGTPWASLPDRGCGWWVNPTVDGIADGLRQATSLDRQTLAAMGEKGRQWVADEFGWARIAPKMLTMYEGLLTSTSR